MFSKPFARVAGVASLGLVLGGVTLPVAACSYDNDNLRNQAGPTPVIVSLVVTSSANGQSATVARPAEGPCCTFGVLVTFSLPGPDFVAKAEVVFAEQGAVHTIALADPINTIDAGSDSAVDAAATAQAGATRSVSFPIDFPSALASTGTRRHDFDVTLVSGRGERSVAVTGEISVL